MERGLWVHLGLLVVAGGASLYVWTRDPKASAAPLADVTVWSGRSEDVQRLVYETTAKKISVESRTDDSGRYFLGVAQTTPAAPPDGGAAAPAKTVSFVSVTAAQKIADALGPFKALREVGRIDSARAGEFGFKDPAPTLLVTIGGRQRHLTLGGATPSGGDRYVRDDGSGLVYAARSDFVRDLETGEGALMEREPHSLQNEDFRSVRIAAAGKAREVVRGGASSKPVWGDPSSPDKADETVSNWLSKVERLRPSEYVGDLPAPHETVVRLDYVTRRGPKVFFELAKAPNPSGKPDYFFRSENTRLWAKVQGPWAEQVEQDLSGLLK